MRRVLRNRSFAVLWVGGLLSLTGDWLLMTGLPLVVYQLTGSAAALGLAVFARMAPRVVVGSVAGVFVDRWDRRKTMLVCNMLLAAGLLPLLLVRSADDLWLIAIVVLFEASVAQVYQPAEGALLPLIVPDEDLITANALNGLSMNVARLCGPPLGALLVATGGLTAVVVVDAASFMVAAGSVWLVRATASGHASQRAVWHEWLEGLNTVRHNSQARMLFIFVAITGVGEGLISTLFVPFATRVMHGDAFTYGALLSAQAVGGVAGGVLVGRFGSRVPPTVMLGGAAVLFGLGDLGLFYAPLFIDSALVPLALIACVGAPSAAMMAAILTLVQTSVSDQLRGRLLGTLFATTSLAGLIGTTVAGAFGDVVGIVPLLTVQALGYLLGGLVVLASRSEVVEQSRPWPVSANQ